MQKEPMNILERLAVMTFVMITIAALIRGCYYG